MKGVKEVTMDVKYMIGELEEDYDLLTYDCEPTTEEWKIASDIGKIIDFLKGQEPITPRSVSRHGATSQIQHFFCKCNAILFHKNQKYCIECGTQQKWKKED